jgi:Flp pilus assembly pilin Flp
VFVVTDLRSRARRALGRLEEQVGATAVEYALMLALIFMVVIVAVQFLGQSTNNAYGSMSFSP